MAGRRFLAIVAAALLAACGGTLSQSAPLETSGPPSAAPTPSARPSPTLPPGVTKVVQIGERVFGIAAAGDTIWVEGVDRLIQLDAVTGDLRGDLPGREPTIDGAALWYLRDRDLVEADPATGTERAVHSVPELGTKVVDGVLWAASEEKEILFAIDLDTNRVLHETKLPQGEPKWVEAWQGAIWVVIDGAESGVVRVDPERGDVISTFAIPGKRPHSMATGFGSLWVTDHGSANLYRFGPNGTLEATIPGPGWDVAIAATGDEIWAAGSTGLLRVDPATNRVVGEIALGGGDWYGLAYAGGFLWLTSGEGKRVLQIPVPAPS